MVERPQVNRIAINASVWLKHPIIIHVSRVVVILEYGFGASS